MEKFSVETIRRVYDDSLGVFLEIGPDSEGNGGIQIRTTNKESEEYFGKIDFTLYNGKFIEKFLEAFESAYEEME